MVAALGDPFTAVPVPYIDETLFWIRVPGF